MASVWNFKMQFRILAFISVVCTNSYAITSECTDVFLEFPAKFSAARLPGGNLNHPVWTAGFPETTGIEARELIEQDPSSGRSQVAFFRRYSEVPDRLVAAFSDHALYSNHQNRLLQWFSGLGSFSLVSKGGRIVAHEISDQDLFDLSQNLSIDADNSGSAAPLKVMFLKGEDPQSDGDDQISGEKTPDKPVQKIRALVLGPSGVQEVLTPEISEAPQLPSYPFLLKGGRLGAKRFKMTPRDGEGNIYVGFYYLIQKQGIFSVRFQGDRFGFWVLKLTPNGRVIGSAYSEINNIVNLAPSTPLVVAESRVSFVVETSSGLRQDSKQIVMNLAKPEK